MASHTGPLGISLERVLQELQTMQPLLPTYAHLIISAVFPIYAAAHASLARPPSAGPSVKKDDGSEASEHDEIEETSPKIETLTPSDALLFPVMAGCTLASLYFILKFLRDPAWLNWFLGIYFAGIGFFFLLRFLQDIFSVARSFVLPRQYSRGGRVWQAMEKEGHYVTKATDGSQSYNNSPLPGPLASISLSTKLTKYLWGLRRLVYTKARIEFSIRRLVQLKIPVEPFDLVSITLTALIVVYHTFIDKPWYLTNVLGFAFCYGSLQFMTPGTSWTGTLLLAALFFYDIYFVFFTPMMITVATKLDVPIKLLFPKPDGCVLPVGAAEGSEAMDEYLRCVAKKRTMAMLGLGDIVVPGMMLAFALRFDLYLFYLRKKGPTTSQDDEMDPHTNTSIDKLGGENTTKPAYQPATGFWGERFWVSSALHQQLYSGKKFPKPYFYATVTGYIIGMITTVVVMQIANHAQPALLYLVPGVLISLWATALVKGDLKLLWKYSEIPEDEGAGSDKKSEAKKIEAAHAKSKDEGISDGIEERQNITQPTTETDNKVNPSQRGQNDEDKTKRKQLDKMGPDNHLLYFAIILPDTNAAGSESAITQSKMDAKPGTKQE